MPTENDTHLPDQLLELYALGRLPEEQLAGFEEHLLICPACQDRLAETDAYVEAARQAARNFLMLPPSRWQLIWARMASWLEMPAPVWTAAAAVLLLVLVLAPRWILPRPERTPALTVLLSTARSGEVDLFSKVPSGRPLHLSWDASTLPQRPCCVVELVDAVGVVIMRRQLEPTDSLRTEPLPAGRYWLRLHELGPESALLREFGLRVE